MIFVWLHLKLQAPVPVCSDSMEKSSPHNFHNFFILCFTEKVAHKSLAWINDDSILIPLTEKSLANSKADQLYPPLLFCNLSMTSHELRRFCTEAFTQWSVCKHDSAITLYQIHMCINSCFYSWKKYTHWRNCDLREMHFTGPIRFQRVWLLEVFSPQIVARPWKYSRWTSDKGETRRKVEQKRGFKNWR